MNAKKFLVVNLLSFILLVIGYVWFVDKFVVIDREIPYTYKQFLLESTTSLSGKVIIESGSNSIYSLDPFLLSQYFNAPTITISDNAGYPLKHKIHRLKKFINENDVIILPLEWSYYNEKDILYANYVSDIADKDLRLEYYFNALPFVEKVKFLLTQYPLQHVINSVRQERDNYRMLIEDFSRSYIFESLVNSDSRETFGNSSLNAPTNAMLPLSDKVTCDEHNFQNEFIISDIFKSNLSLLKTLIKEGAAVYFTWPGMSDRKGSRCYQINNVEKYVDEITKIVETAGFKFIGDFEKSHFPVDCILDSHYHLTAKCATTRTHRLLNELKVENIPKINSSRRIGGFIPFLNNSINKARSNITRKISSQIPSSSTGRVDFYKNMVFLNGWSYPEDFGRWSLDKESIFSFKVAPDLLNNKMTQIRIKGQYFNGNEKTRVEINNKLFGSHVLIDKTFFIPTNIISKDRIVTIRLNHTSPTSPFLLNLSSDTRKIKFAINLVEIMDQDKLNPITQTP